MIYSTDLKDIKILSLEEGTIVKNIPEINSNLLRSVIATNDSKYIISSGDDKVITIYDWK